MSVSKRKNGRESVEARVTQEGSLSTNQLRELYIVWRKLDLVGGSNGDILLVFDNDVRASSAIQQVRPGTAVKPIVTIASSERVALLINSYRFRATCSQAYIVTFIFRSAI